MGIIVSKFGGSSLADADCFQRVRKILSDRTRQHYIIVSAPGRRGKDDEKITDLLCQSHHLFATGGNGSGPLKEVIDRFTGIHRQLALSLDLPELLAPLEWEVRHSADLAASRGEYLCARLFCAYTGIPFVDSSSLIHFDRNGKILRKRIADSILAMSKRLPYAVIPGFYGSMPDGEIKTFSRGGSDITGALTAAALNADVYENWTDVNGLMSIDPSICSAAVCHPSVSYRQMRRLAQAGAKVLHPYCLEPVCEAGVPTVLKNTFAPERPGTYISDRVRRHVPCLSTREGFWAVEAECLCTEGRLLAEGLRADRYQNACGQSFFAPEREIPCCSRPVTMVSLFGLPTRFFDQAVEIASPIAWLGAEDCLRLLVEPAIDRTALCRLHELLISAY